MFGFLRNKTFWIILITVIVAITVVKNTSLEQVGDNVVIERTRELYTPLRGGLNALREKLNQFGTYMTSKERLVDENKKLQAEVNRLQLENQRLLEDSYEARTLRALLEFKDANKLSLDLTGAEVIGRSPSNWYKTIEIDKGSNDGLTTNMVVVATSGLVGRIINVTSKSAVVLLITDVEGAVGVITQQSRTPGIVEGEGKNGMLRMTHIPYYSEIHIGDRVITSQFSQLYPLGILIGKVKSITSDPNGLSKSAVIKPAVDFDKLEKVFVIKKFKEVNRAQTSGDQSLDEEYPIKFY